jgi:hypothetical protein
MSKSTLNWIAAALFVVAAVGNYVGGPLWLAILFTVLAVLSVFQAVRG